MGQPGFFDLENRYACLDAYGDPLVAINAAASFELFWVKLKTALIKGGLRRSQEDRMSPAGRTRQAVSACLKPNCARCPKD